MDPAKAHMLLTAALMIALWIGWQARLISHAVLEYLREQREIGRNWHRCPTCDGKGVVKGRPT